MIWYMLNNQYLKYGVYEDKKWEPNVQRTREKNEPGAGKLSGPLQNCIPAVT